MYSIVPIRAMNRAIGVLSIIFLLLLLWVLLGTCQEEGRKMRGDKYTRGDYMGRFLFVTFLKEGYQLEKRPQGDPELSSGIATPGYEMDVRCYVTKQRKVFRRIESLNDFSGLVNVDSPEKAIEFVRLRTSGTTYFLFRPCLMMEVFKRRRTELGKDFIWGGASPVFFEKHKLKELRITKKEGGFEIGRYLISFPWPGAKEYPHKPQLLRVTERVLINGDYTIDKDLIVSDIDFMDIPYPGPPM